MLFVTETKELNINTNLSVLYFYTNSITYHNKMIVMISKVEEKYPNVIFFAIDCDYFKDLYKQFVIDTLPFIVIFSNGKEIFKTGKFYKTKSFIHIFNKLTQNN